MIARRCSTLAVDFMRKGLEKVGAPADLLQVMERPDLQDIQPQMAAADLGTQLAHPVGTAAHPSEAAHGVGVGNSVSIVDETADVEHAANTSD